jgi:hypothetical protein
MRSPFRLLVSRYYPMVLLFHTRRIVLGPEVRPNERTGGCRLLSVAAAFVDPVLVEVRRARILLVSPCACDD